ncbi:nibrin isoform X2 [Eurytemora carolleeae]|uniref:nibrin isoform X2 n=1 Tax=Eurytemora carolleeae TaxID=1294199 RepID=UPI000C773D4D|nr:nibrin isoform X2 [Eurytemora carolleeae]|eukprot:XP_023327330.1 nibrin-like isoform X2 [Eurytemora affinis]
MFSKETGRALSKPVELKDNDRIRFGTGHSICRLRWLKLEVISSMLKDPSSVNNWLKEIDNTKIQPRWSETTTHLVMTAIQLSPKVANCLANCVPIVTPEYFRDFIACVKSKQRLPDADNYLPAVSSSESENMLRNPGVNLRRNLNRKSLFKGKLFLFLAEAQRTEMDLPITLCGGSTQIWNPDQDMNMLDSDDNLLVRPKSGKTQEVGKGFSSILLYLERKGRIAVQATGIYLAIVHCNFNKCSNIRSSSQVLPPKGFNQSLRSQVLAPESLQPVSGLNTSTFSPGTFGDSRTRGSPTPSSVNTNKTSAPTNHISQYPSSMSKSVQDPSFLSKPVQNPSSLSKSVQDSSSISKSVQNPPFVNSGSSSTSGSGFSINKVPEYSGAKDKDKSEDSVKSLRTYILTEHSPASMETVKFQDEVSEVPKVMSNIFSREQERKRPLSSGEDVIQPAVKKPALQPSPRKTEPNVQDQPLFDDEDDDMFACLDDIGENQKPASIIQKSPQKSSSKEEDDNIFGFGVTALKNQRQQIVPETQTINRKRKAPGPEDNLFGFGESSLLSKKKAVPSKNGDDIFGFGSPEKPKRKDEFSQASKPSDKTEIKSRVGPAESKPKNSDMDPSFGNTTTTSSNSTQSISRPSHNTTGFLEV